MLIHHLHTGGFMARRLTVILTTIKNALLIVRPHRMLTAMTPAKQSAIRGIVTILGAILTILIGDKTIVIQAARGAPPVPLTNCSTRGLALGPVSDRGLAAK
jgi:hypothetical protein